VVADGEEEMKKVCVVQARMGNSRMPGKNGLMILGKPQIWHVLNRVKKATTFTEIMLAIPHEANGGIMKEAARDLDIPVLDYKGNSDDLVHRYCLAADIMDGDIIIRIPGDNTMIDPDEIDRIVKFYDGNPARWNWLTTNLDRNVMGNGYPGGLGAEVWDVRFLHWLDKEVAFDKAYKEHPHKWAFEHQQLRTISAPAEIRAPDLDLSLNTQEQYELALYVYKELGTDFRARDVLRLLDARPFIRQGTLF